MTKQQLKYLFGGLQTAQTPSCTANAVKRGIWLVEALRDPETTKKPPTEGTERPPSSLRAVRQRRQGGQITHDTHSRMDLPRNREAEETETEVCLAFSKQKG